MAIHKPEAGADLPKEGQEALPARQVQAGQQQHHLASQQAQGQGVEQCYLRGRGRASTRVKLLQDDPTAWLP